MTRTRRRQGRQCPKGYTLRKGYVRKYTTAMRERGYTRVRDGKKVKVYPTANKMYIKPKCIKDKSVKTATVKRIGPLRSGDLLKHGYQYRLPSDIRHGAIKRAVKEYGPLSTYRKLDAVAKLGAKKMPDAAKVFAADRDWVRAHYSLKAF